MPFIKGLKITLQAWQATKTLTGPELSKAGGRNARVEPLAGVLMATLQKALRENEAHGQPSDFIYDATRQYVLNEYEKEKHKFELQKINDDEAL